MHRKGEDILGKGINTEDLHPLYVSPVVSLVKVAGSNPVKILEVP